MVGKLEYTGMTTGVWKFAVTWAVVGKGLPYQE